MKSSFKLTLIFFLFGIFGGILLISYTYYSKTENFFDETLDNLNNIAESKTKRINNYLDSVEKDILILQESDEVKELLEQDLVFDESVIKEDVNQRARIITKDVENYLKNFKENYDYNNLLLISPDGYIVYMAEKKEILGTNLEWLVNSDGGISKNYVSVKKKGDIEFYGPFVEFYGDIYPKISVMAPVYDKGNLSGFVTLLDEMDKIFDITEELNDFSETKETYLVDNEKFLISPIRNKDLDILVQSVYTENSEECLEDLEKFYNPKTGRVEEHEEGVEKLERFLGYRGEEVLGTHSYILKLKWCLLTEISEEESIGLPVREMIKNRIIISVFAVLILTLIGYFVGRFFDKKRKSGRKR